MAGHKEIPVILDGLKELHASKSAGYGSDDDCMANFNNVASFSKRPAFMYALDRIVEKTTRAYNLERNGRLDQVEEELLDICLLAALSEAMRRDLIAEYDEPFEPTRTFTDDSFPVGEVVPLGIVQRKLPSSEPACGTPGGPDCTCDSETFGAHSSTCERYRVPAHGPRL